MKSKSDDCWSRKVSHLVAILAFAFAQFTSAAHAETHHDLHVHHDQHHLHHGLDDHNHDHAHLGSHDEHGNQGDPREACLICCLASSDDDNDALPVATFKTFKNPLVLQPIAVTLKESKSYFAAAVSARGPPNT